MAKPRDPVIADMAIRVARAEMERDAALAREQEALRQAQDIAAMYHAVIGKDKEKILDTVQLLGIPARDFRDMYEIEAIWNREGGSQSMLDWWREKQSADL